jgi:hypothetical protein
MRGVLWEEAWFERFKGYLSQFPLNIHGNISCTHKLQIALGFAFKDQHKYMNRKPVLFCFSIQNYFTPEGFRANSKYYSAYPREAELIIKENTPFYKLSVQPVSIVSSESDFYEK